MWKYNGTEITSATIGTINAQLSGSNKNWTLSLLPDQFQNLKEGAVPFSIAFKDQNQNSGVTVTTTTNSSSVIYDNLVSSTVTITTSDVNNIVTNGEQVDVSFLFNEEIDENTLTLDIDFQDDSFDLTGQTLTENSSNNLLYLLVMFYLLLFLYFELNHKNLFQLYFYYSNHV